MNWSAGWIWWSTLRAKGGASPRGESEPDFADMGTAFGLDASFGRAEPADANPACSTPAPWQHPSTRRSAH
jgi:hypothetical protein